MNSNITITVIDREGISHELETPTDMGLNLMELCKSYDLPVLGTCGGMAMCASCQVYVENEKASLDRSDDEQAMLDDAWHVLDNSRLGCQIHLSLSHDGLIVRLAPSDDF